MALEPKCARCDVKKCREGKDCFNKADEIKPYYKDESIQKLHKAATKIEGDYYCKENRLNEIILFAKELNFKKIGLAFCVGLSEEARIIEDILSKHFDVVSVCCKVCAINKKTFELTQIIKDKEEYMCNPAAQAVILNEAHTEFNVICGLCVGHDSIFTMLSKAPVTTLIAKDRTLAHNPVGAIYCQYIKRNF